MAYVLIASKDSFLSTVLTANRRANKKETVGGDRTALSHVDRSLLCYAWRIGCEYFRLQSCPWPNRQSLWTAGDLKQVLISVMNEGRMHCCGAFTKETDTLRNDYKTVLYLSSEAAIESDVSALLENWGFHVVRAGNKHAILLFFAAGIHINLVVMDAYNADNNYDCLRSIRKTAPCVPVIVLSHRISGLKYMNAQYFGEQEYLEMSVDDRDLMQIVQRAADKNRIKQQPNPRNISRK